MIRVSELRNSMKKIISQFKTGQNPISEIQALHGRLNEEVTRICTDLDYVLVELRSNLETYLKQKFPDITAAFEFFKVNISKKFTKDLTSSEIPRFVELANELEQLL